MIYVYFDKNGVVKEIINDNATRVGNSNSDRVYFYFEDSLQYDNIFCLIKRADESLSNEVSIIENREERDIPYSKNRDLKCFEDYKKYNFYYYELTTEDTENEGLCCCTVRTIYNGKIYAQGLVTFNVQENIIKTDKLISQSQYDYLLKEMSKYLLVTEGDERYVNVEGDDTVKGTIYTEANTPYLIGKKGMVGIRAYMPKTDLMAGQFAVSYYKTEDGIPTDKDGNYLYDDDEGNIETDGTKFHYFTNIVMTDENGNNHSLRLDKTGLYYISFNRFDKIATEDYVDNEIDKLVNTYLTGEGVKNVIDTLQDFADWITDDKSGAVKIIQDVDNLEKSVDSLDTKIDDSNNYLGSRISDLEQNTIVSLNESLKDYQSKIVYGTYIRLLKYKGNTLYAFGDSSTSIDYSISQDGGKTWKYYSSIVWANKEGDITDVANAFPILSPNNDGRIIVFFRANNKENNYYSIRCVVSDTNGKNFGKSQILHSNSTGLWEPFYYEGWLYYSLEHTKGGEQSQYRRKLEIVDDKVTCVKLSNGSDSVMAIGGLIGNKGNVNIDGTKTWARIGMVSATPLKTGGHIYVFESTINRNASKPRPMVVQYCYGKTPQNEAIGTTDKTTLFMGDEEITCGAPYVTTLNDGRIAISFQTDQYYKGKEQENVLNTRQVVTYVSKREIYHEDNLTADDFVKINNYNYGENESSLWGSVQNINGLLYNTFTLRKEKNDDYIRINGIVKVLDVNSVDSIVDKKYKHIISFGVREGSEDTIKFEFESKRPNPYSRYGTYKILFDDLLEIYDSKTLSITGQTENGNALIGTCMASEGSDAIVCEFKELNENYHDIVSRNKNSDWLHYDTDIVVE